MLEKISSNWWMFALRGLVAVIFGVMALIWHEHVLQALVVVFGAFALVNGIMTVFTGISSAPYFSRWWVLLLEGVSGVICGLMGIFMPGITTYALMYLIAAWALFTGISEIMVAIQFRRMLTDEWMLVLGGLISIGFGVMLFVFPAAGAVSITWLIGFYAIVLGSSEMIFAFRLRGLRSEVKKVIEAGI